MEAERLWDVFERVWVLFYEWADMYKGMKENKDVFLRCTFYCGWAYCDTQQISVI